jgi:cytochrome c-type biogenesis protein CcmH
MAMTENERPRLRIGTIFLLLAMLVAGFSIAVSVKRSADVTEAAANGEPLQAAAADPLEALRTRTVDNPKDQEAWSALATGYFETGQFEAATAAYDSALKLAPQRAVLWSGRGEARVMASERDPMPIQAVADFEQAIKLDPRDPRARYFLAVKQDLGGDHSGAIESWLALLADTQPGAAWEADLRRTIEQVGKINRIEVASRLAKVRQPSPLLPPAARAIPGPTAQDLSRASALRPDEQRKMAEGMVARLEARLKADPRNIDGWIMLIRSRATLGQSEQARAALAQAVAANPASEAKLREQAGLLGIR